MFLSRPSRRNDPDQVQRVRSRRLACLSAQPGAPLGYCRIGCNASYASRMINGSPHVPAGSFRKASDRQIMSSIRPFGRAMTAPFTVITIGRWISDEWAAMAARISSSPA